MSITYTWKVSRVSVKNEGSNIDSVVQTHWEKTGTDEDGLTGTFHGGTPFTSVNVPTGEFIAFEDLTEEIILGWIQAQVVGDYENHVNDTIQNQINSKKNPVVEKTLPWASAN